jgi:hypothetical protein
LGFEFALLPPILVCVMLKLFQTAVTGCFSKTRTTYHAGDEAPPPFMAGPAAVLLTNLDGFSAHLTASIPQRDGQRRQMSGDLLEREGRLIFQPQTGVKGKHARSEGGMFFIWHEDRNTGYILSDPLQAYAPVMSRVQVTNIAWNTSGATEEQAGGHPCRRLEAILQSSDGSSVRYMVWQAEDLKRFPMRIAQVGGGPGLTLDFTNVRLELPAPELFYPPEGFTKYESPTALMNELIVRQSAYVKSESINPPGGEPLPVTGPANMHPVQTPP